MIDDHAPSDREAAELAAYADGSMPVRERGAFERRLAQSPRLRALLDEQRRALAITTASAEPAPAHLTEAVRSLPTPTHTRRSRKVIAAAAFAGAVACGVLVIALVLPSEGPGTPSFAAAAAASALEPVGPAPPRPQAEGLAYPDWSDYGWRATGERSDLIGGRRATTVFYSRAGRRIGYTIVAGPPIAPASGARTERLGGTALRHLRLDGRWVVEWLRRGRTCILAGRELPAHTLLELASTRE